MAKATIRARSIALAPTADSRSEADLIYHLNMLTPWHGITTLPPTAQANPVPDVTVTINAKPGAPNVFTLDVGDLKQRLPSNVTVADLVIIPRGRPGEELFGRLEDAPDMQIDIDLNNPPGWLQP